LQFGISDANEAKINQVLAEARHSEQDRAFDTIMRVSKAGSPPRI